MAIMNAGEYLHYVLDGIERRCWWADDARDSVVQESVEGMALNRMARLDLDDGTDPHRRARADQATDLWLMNRSHQRRVRGESTLPACGDEADEFARFLLVRREPEYLIDQYAGTCALVAGHLETVAAIMGALHRDDAFAGRWDPDLPAWCADIALERAAVWHALAVVPDRVRGTYVDILTGAGS